MVLVVGIINATNITSIDHVPHKAALFLAVSIKRNVTIKVAKSIIESLKVEFEEMRRLLGLAGGLSDAVVTFVT